MRHTITPVIIKHYRPISLIFEYDAIPAFHENESSKIGGDIRVLMNIYTCS